MAEPTDSAPMPLARPRTKVHFEPTINLGHMLTLISMLGAGAVAFSSLQSRLAVHDEQIRGLERTQGIEKAYLAEALNGLRDDVKETKRAVDEVRRGK